MKASLKIPGSFLYFLRSCSGVSCSPFLDMISGAAAFGCGGKGNGTGMSTSGFDLTFFRRRLRAAFIRLYSIGIGPLSAELANSCNRPAVNSDAVPTASGCGGGVVITSIEV